MSPFIVILDEKNDCARYVFNEFADNVEATLFFHMAKIKKQYLYFAFRVLKHMTSVEMIKECSSRPFAQSTFGSILSL